MEVEDNEDSIPRHSDHQHEGDHMVMDMVEREELEDADADAGSASPSTIQGDEEEEKEEEEEFDYYPAAARFYFSMEMVLFNWTYRQSEGGYSYLNMADSHAFRFTEVGLFLNPAAVWDYDFRAFWADSSPFVRDGRAWVRHNVTDQERRWSERVCRPPLCWCCGELRCVDEDW